MNNPISAILDFLLETFLYSITDNQPSTHKTERLLQKERDVQKRWETEDKESSEKEI